MKMNSKILAFAAACFISATNALEYPGDNCCTLWSKPAFRDTYKKTVCHNGSNPNWGDVYNEYDLWTVHSMFCGKNVEFLIR